MEKKLDYYLILFSIIFISCGAQENENIKLKEEVIAVHDEVMPLIGELNFYKQKLLEKANELRDTGDTVNSSEEIKNLKGTANSCQKAYDDMFVWMRQFKSEYSEMTEEETKHYLNDQLKKVKLVNKDIKSTLADAEKLLSQD